jgi:hypothetical protein
LNQFALKKNTMYSFESLCFAKIKGQEVIIGLHSIHGQLRNKRRFIMAALRLNQSSEMGISLPIPDTIEALMEDKKPIPKSFAPKTSPRECAQDKNDQDVTAKPHK